MNRFIKIKKIGGGGSVWRFKIYVTMPFLLQTYVLGKKNASKNLKNLILAKLEYF